ncbi:hypothetical protein GLOTRDRAFT_126623 [Gloeophyllum trabeum ATCC 11539]|uniref:RNI-like protein n=1 Tax=Gloeophyllum trabeum (strain ATCC 11539 / FP-39264 / Madison 617) TaxID=670483 RepID=S7QE98_GLOTA|nr:uncharacterized protein GLOTRDRAFT_126623 [Gloeophyllum trabeum ATCC 11539]EPQ58131.1 hypothetical protein GLOTRDRAFT_126623 [Gloeophyllum trabeum ATCC 11539]
MGLRLWDPKARVTSDEAGTTITKYVLPPAYNPGPYERDPDGDEEHGLTYAPSLAYFCVKALIEVADQVHLIGSARLRYRAPEVEGSYDPLRALLPSYGTDAFDLSKVDPRLWAVLIQVYENLPDDIRTYRLPLADKHLPLLQSIPSTLDFTLITLLDLSRCPELTDNTIVELKALHCLVALDASMTEVSTHGIRGLSRTLQCTVDQETGMKRRGGPWGLRILRLRRCEKLSDAIFSCLASFPLLSLTSVELDAVLSRAKQAASSPVVTRGYDLVRYVKALGYSRKIAMVLGLPKTNGYSRRQTRIS